MSLAARRKFARTLGCGMGYRPALDAGLGQVVGHQVAEVTIADQQGARLVELAMDLPPQLDDAGGHRDRLRGYIRFAPHPLGSRQC